MKTLITFLLALTLLSCASKKIKESSKKLSSLQIKEIKKDSVLILKTSRPINDLLKLPVVKSNTSNKKNDSIINAKVDEILSKLNTSKQSGNNSYNLFYDIGRRILRLETSIGETTDQSLIVINNSKEETILEETTREYLYKKIIRTPWWVFAGFVVFFLPKIFKIFMAVANPLSAFFKK
jgi:hypothetical protein